MLQLQGYVCFWTFLEGVSSVKHQCFVTVRGKAVTRRFWMYESLMKKDVEQMTASICYTVSDNIK